MLKEFTSLFLKHTLPSRRHLTPELVLRLITPSCELWSSPVENSPFNDPFWGFYWPGGQATASALVGRRCRIRQILQVCRTKSSSLLMSLMWMRLAPSTCDKAGKSFNRTINAIFESEEPCGTPLVEDNVFHQLLTAVFEAEVALMLIRYILDNPKLLEHRRVLDVGCGCGAGAIAAAKVNANRTIVVANDIDKYALIASKINAELNAASIKTDSNNYVGSNCDDFDTILTGDMFYDEEFAAILFDWLNRLAEDGKMVLIGDPGRHGLTPDRRSRLTPLASYDLLKEARDENHGLTRASVWMLGKL